MGIHDSGVRTWLEGSNIVLVRHQPILSQARALTRGRLTLVGLLRAQARIRPAAVVGLVLVRGIAPGRAPLHSTADAAPGPFCSAHCELAVGFPLWREGIEV